MIIEDIANEIIVLYYLALASALTIIFIMSYIIGSIPCGVMISKLNGVDIMKEGSCSPGYTNVKRVLGLKWGILVFILDILKTLVSIILSLIVFIWLFEIFGHPNNEFLKLVYEPYPKSKIIMYDFTGEMKNVIIFLSGLGAILGHNYPIFNHFKGGKGITCTLATCLMFNPYWAIGLFVIYFATKKITKYVSLGSIIALCCLFISALILTILKIYPFDFKNAKYVLPILLVIVVINIYRHKENIIRLKNGNENKTK